MLSIPAAGDDNMVKKTSCCLQGLFFLCLLCLAVIPGKGGGNEQSPQDADENGISFDFHESWSDITS
ncbi:MAG: hypothetical protein K0A99_05910 [Desulfoarculaceae bacterium]|nr:hypothetical protein [Desulfoarculaceae bacterium]